MLSPAQFYLNHYDSDDPFGNLRPSGNRHLGSDFNGMSAGTEIPSWCQGTVTSSGWSSVIGWYLIVRTKHGGWAGFYHMQSQSPRYVGEGIGFGDFIGYLGNTGTASLGAHLHTMWSTRDGSPGTGDVDDPWPAIKTIIAQLSGARPAGEEGTLINEIEEDENMATEMVWIVARVSTDSAASVKADSVWYQKSPGSELVKLADDYRTSSEYTQLAQMRGPSAATVYTAIAGDGILALVGKYGQVAGYKPGAVSVGSVTVAADPALLAAVRENTVVQSKVLAAVLALNPPG